MCLGVVMNIIEKENLLNKLNEEVSILLEKEKRTFKMTLNWNARTIHGQCCKNYITGVNEIKISKFLEKDEEIKNTMLHELCHLYDDTREHHGYQWQEYARVIGMYYDTKITRTSSKSMGQAQLNAYAKVTCPNCGATVYVYRRSNQYYHPEWYRCGQCGNHNLQIERYK